MDLVLLLGFLVNLLPVLGNLHTESGPLLRRLDTTPDDTAMTDDEPYFLVGRSSFGSALSTTLKISAAFKDFVFLPSPPVTTPNPTSTWYNIRSVTTQSSSGWEVATSVQRPCGAAATAPASTDFSFLAIRPGWYEYLSSSATFIANKTEVAYGDTPTTIHFQSSWHAGAIFDDVPVVIAQVQSTAATPNFLNVRVHEVMTDQMKVSLVATEDNVGTGTKEVVGWAAFQATNISMPTGVMSAFTVPQVTDPSNVYVLDPKLAIPQQCGEQVVLATSNGGDAVSKSALPMLKSVNSDGTSDAYVGSYSCASGSGNAGAKTGTLGVVVYQFGMCAQFNPASQSLVPIDSKTSGSSNYSPETYNVNTIIWMIVGSICVIAFMIGMCYLYNRTSNTETPSGGQQPGGPRRGPPGAMQDPYYAGAGAYPQQPPNGYAPNGAPARRPF